MQKFMKYFYFIYNSCFGTFILVFPYHGDIVLLFRENRFLILSFSKSENTQSIPTIPTFHDLNSYFFKILSPTLSLPFHWWALESLSLEFCRRSRPVQQIMIFVFPAFTLSPFFSIASFQVKSLLTHSSSDSAMITRSSA